MANKEDMESLKNLEIFKHNVSKFKNYLTAYESFYQNLAKPYFLRISHDKEARKIQYKGLKLADMQFNGKNLPADGWQQMEDHTKIGYMFICAHNFLVNAYGIIYDKKENANSQVSLHEKFAKKRKLQDVVIKWGDDINEKRKVLTSCLNELTSEDDLGNKRVQFEFLSGATSFVEKTYIEKWELYTFRKGGQKTVENETLFWADLLLSKVLRWEKDTTTRLWSIPFMATNSNTKRGSSKSSTESQRKKIFIVDSSDEESDFEEEPKNTSSADVISSTVGESTALSDSLSKSVFTEDASSGGDDPKIASNSKDDGFLSSSQSKPTSNPEEGVDDGVVKSSEPSESSLSTLKRKRVVDDDDDDDDDGEESEKEDEFAEPEEEVIFDDKNAVVQLTNFTYDYVNLNTDDSTTTFLVDEFKQMFIQLVDHRYEMVTDEFTASMELLMKFVQCKQRFSSFFIMCESIPETYAQKNSSS